MTGAVAVTWIEFVGGRKFALAAAALVFAFILALLGKLTTDFTAVLIAVTAFFTAGNTVTTKAAITAAAAKEEA